MQEEVIAQTTNGRIRGIRHRNVESYLGVPYGAPTGGANRFRPPQPVREWRGVRDATAYGDAAPQEDTRLSAQGPWVEVMSQMYPRTGVPTEGGRMSEDCLVVNVWTPNSQDAGARPVLVWLHGGGYTTGSGNEMMFQGDELARLGDVIVVTVNHRLGLLGFMPLDRADPNYAHSSVAGMLDIVQALEWVRDNIAQFGGDPQNVTIFGQSGGGAKVSILAAMPAARGLYHKVINQSGSSMALTDEADVEQILDEVLLEAGLTHADAADLAALPLAQLMNIQHSLHSRGGSFSLDGTPSTLTALLVGPAFDAEHLPVAPFTPLDPATDDIPMLIGYTSHDVSLLICGHPDYASFNEDDLRTRLRNTHGDDADATYNTLRADHPDEAPRLLLARLMTDATFRSGAIRMAEAKSRQTADVYAYEFAYQLPLFDYLLGAPHSGEILYAFNNVGRATFAGDRPSRHAVARDTALAWAAFAWTGNPNHPGIPTWAPYSHGRTTMRIDTEWEPYNGPTIEELGADRGGLFAK